MPLWATNDNSASRITVASLALVAAVLLAVSLPSSARYNQQVQETTPGQVGADPWQEDLAREVGIIEKVNSPVPADLVLIDEDGKPVKLDSFFKAGRPVVFNLGYGRCPSICPAMRRQLVETLGETDLHLGEDFIVLNISIDPAETPELSRQLRKMTFEDLEEQGVDAEPEGWRYLTADQETITALTDGLGYRYLYIAPQNEYGHPGVLVLADGEGTIRRYLSGTAYSGRTLRLSIVETSEGKVGSLLDRAFVTCFTWDPKANNYAATAKFIMMVGGGVTIVALGGLVLFGLAYEKRRRQLIETQGESGPGVPPAIGGRGQAGPA